MKFYVVAENGDKGIEYTITYKRGKSNDPVLSDTNLLDVTMKSLTNKLIFDPTLYEYNIQLPYGHDEMYIKGHTESKGGGQLFFGEGAYALLPGVTKVIRLRVTAEDGTVAEKEYKFNITRALPNTDTI